MMSSMGGHEPRIAVGHDFTLGNQLLLGVACGLLIANLYYAQPLTGLIIASLGMPPQSAGLLVTLPLMGYGFGLLMIAPLGDLIENRRLVLALVRLEAHSVPAAPPSSAINSRRLIPPVLPGSGKSIVAVTMRVTSAFTQRRRRAKSVQTNRGRWRAREAHDRRANTVTCHMRARNRH